MRKEKKGRGLVGGLLAIAAVLATAQVQAVPSFARQTGMPCTACHTVFPELTSFGRSFKLNGYTMTGTAQVSQDADKAASGVSVDASPPLSAMLQVGITHLSKAEDSTQNNDVQFPQQFSLFYAGKISDHLGAFVQITYDQAGGAVALDNTDVRYANSTTMAGKALTYGLTLNNNPTVQDLWHSSPAWGFPYLASGSAPTPTASPFMGGLGQDVTGLGAYGLWNEMIYAELSLYRSSHQGQAKPDAASSNTITGSAPYWRLAWQHAAENGDYMMVGLNGMSMSLIPAGITPPADKYSDKVLDAQYEHHMNDNMLVMHASVTSEKQTLDASMPGFSPTLRTVKLDGSYHCGSKATTTLGVWKTTGDEGDYSATYGYANPVSKPDNSGWIGEVSYLPWQNTRLSLQYTAYRKFDNLPVGRSASDNNTTFLQGWVVW
ncbi:MAG: hypothetical protein PSX71_13035 [bacterium]|nr:hypothetical protein [bacterium]